MAKAAKCSLKHIFFSFLKTKNLFHKGYIFFLKLLSWNGQITIAFFFSNIYSEIPPLGIYLKKTKQNTHLKRFMHPNVHSSSMNNCQNYKWKVTFKNCIKMAKQNVFKHATYQTHSRGTPRFPAPLHLTPSPLLIATGGSTPLLCLQGFPDLPGAPQDEAGLMRKFET